MGNKREINLETRLTNKRKNRQKLICGLFIVIIALLCVRIGYIKIVHGRIYEQMAIINQLSSGDNKLLLPNRGGIIDRNSKPLASSTIVYTVIFDARLLNAQPETVQDRTVKNLAAALPQLKENDLRLLLAKDENGALVHDTHYIEVANKVPYEQAMEIEKNGDISCVFIKEDTKRTYVNNNLAAHVVGFLRGESGYGLEWKYNAELLGVPGRLYRTFDSRNNAIDNVLEPVEGYTLVTTIDVNIQRIAEAMCIKAGELYEPENVSVIVMDPYTCEILAMAGYPSFNLNEHDNPEYISDRSVLEFWDGMTREEQLNSLYGVWRNRCISSSFEPGSIYKPMVIAAALEENIITPHSPATYYCPGQKYFPQLEEPIRCWAWKSGGHGNQTLAEVIANSCNVAMMDIAAMMGRDIYNKHHKDFGFGERTGIDLPGEESFSVTQYPLSQLNPVELATSSFGQGFTCTPIQAVTAFSALINGGNLMKPYVVSHILDKNGAIVAETKPTVTRKVLTKQTSDYLRETMVGVVSSGTGKNAAIEGYRIGGKTGTGEQGVRAQDEYAYSFLAYLPADNPEIIAMALINRPRDRAQYESSMTVVPLLREVLVDIINYLGIRPTDTESGAVRGALNNGVPMGNYVGQRTSEVIADLNRAELNFSIIGTGGVYVSKQFPEPGMPVDAETTVYLYTSTGDEGLVATPDLIGLTREQALDILDKAGFTPFIADDKNRKNTESGPEAEDREPIVIKQFPEFKMQLERGTQIKMVISY